MLTMLLAEQLRVHINMAKVKYICTVCAIRLSKGNGGEGLNEGVYISIWSFDQD